jgi:hypothetical protein
VRIRARRRMFRTKVWAQKSAMSARWHMQLTEIGTLAARAAVRTPSAGSASGGIHANLRHGLFQGSMPNGLVPQRTDESVRRSYRV